MINTKFGSFDGDSWEQMFQQVLKHKFLLDGYQEVLASPGDYGIEGFTTTGLVFQCYCPDKIYPNKTLYEYQRNKITCDLNKLQTYKEDLQKILGGILIKKWIFITPEIANKNLLSHAKTKQIEVLSWNLPIIDNTFEVLLHDGDYYAIEINTILSSSGTSFDFGGIPETLTPTREPSNFYESNIRRKNAYRLKSKEQSPAYKNLLDNMCQTTLKEFIEHEQHLKSIHDKSPNLGIRLVKLINEYEKQVVERSCVWSGSATDLTESIKTELKTMILQELRPHFTETTALQTARLLVSRWLAVCELEYV